MVLESRTFKFLVEGLTIQVEIACKSVDGRKDDPDSVVPEVVSFTATRPQKVDIRKL